MISYEVNVNSKEMLDVHERLEKKCSLGPVTFKFIGASITNLPAINVDAINVCTQ